MASNRAAAERFIAVLVRRDADAIADLLTDDVVEILLFAASGGAEPAAVFDGRQRVMEVQRVTVVSFETISFAAPCWTESADGRVVFFEARGERRAAGTRGPYRNAYVFKFEFRDGRIRRITEYSNPVSFARFFDRPIG